MGDVPDSTWRARTPYVVAAVAVAVVASAVYVSRTQPQPDQAVVGMFSFGTAPTVRVVNGRWTYSTTLRVIGPQGGTVEEIVPIGRDARPVERAFVTVAGDPPPASSGGLYAPTQVGRDVLPGTVLDVVIEGRPDCAAPDRVIGIRVAVRTRGVGEDTYLVTPPRAASPADELANLGERACER